MILHICSLVSFNLLDKLLLQKSAIEFVMTQDLWEWLLLKSLNQCTWVKILPTSSTADIRLLNSDTVYRQTWDTESLRPIIRLIRDKKVAHEMIAECATDFLSTFRGPLWLWLNRLTAKWNLFVLCNKETNHVKFCLFQLKAGWTVLCPLLTNMEIYHLNKLKQIFIGYYAKPSILIVSEN